MADFVETDYLDRLYFDSALSGTSDGLFSVPHRRIKEIVTTNGVTTARTKFIYKDKPQTTAGEPVKP